MLGEAAAPNSKFGKYTLIRRIAVGGMAEIYLARQEGMAGFARQVVIKRVHEHLNNDPEFISMFLDEARLVAKLSHPNIVSVHEFGQEGNFYYLVMEHVDGESLSAVIKRTKGVEPIHALRVISEICSGLNYAHSLKDDSGEVMGIVHRDVSPQNVLIGFDGSVKLIDFGVAKTTSQSHRTKPGSFKGKYAYMSPEQARGKPADKRSDVHAIGIVLWESLTGRSLFFRESVFHTMEAVLRMGPPSVEKKQPKLADALDKIIGKAMAKKTEERYQSCADVQLAVDGLIADQGLHSSSLGLGRYVRSLFDRHSEPPGASAESTVELEDLEELSVEEDLEELSVEEDLEELSVEEEIDIEEIDDSQSSSDHGKAPDSGVLEKAETRPKNRPSLDAVETNPVATPALDNPPTTPETELPIHRATTDPQLESPIHKARTDPILQGLALRSSKPVNDDSRESHHSPEPISVGPVGLVNPSDTGSLTPPPMLVLDQISQDSSSSIVPTPRQRRGPWVWVLTAVAASIIGGVGIAVMLAVEVEPATDTPQETQDGEVVTEVTSLPQGDANVAQDGGDRVEEAGGDESVAEGAIEVAEMAEGLPTAFLTVHSDPPGARLYIDGRHTGERTSVRDLPLDPGEHVVELSMDGYRLWRRTVDAERGRMLRVRAVLRITEGEPERGDASSENSQPVDYGLLSVDTVPPSRVFQGRRELGPTPLSGVELPAGAYGLVFRIEGGRRFEKTVTIRPGRTTRRQFELIPTEPPQGDDNDSPPQSPSSDE